VKDRLFSVGDLIDRGSDSLKVVNLLKEPWFFSVRGNHEQMAIDYFEKNLDSKNYKHNGGLWFILLTKSKQEQLTDIFRQLPFAFEIDTEEGRVGVIHADCPVDNWNNLDNALTRLELVDVCLWSRDRITDKMEQPIENINKVYFGHSHVNKVTTLGNTIFIDTGAVFKQHGGKLTIIQI
jgi:serine/threonine protein phosphatase 1